MPSFNHATDLNLMSSHSYNTENGEAVEVFRFEPDNIDPTPVTAQNLQTLLLKILGFTAYYGGGGIAIAPTDGKLHRTNPMQHPYFNGLYATSVKLRPVYGTKAYTKITGASVPVGAPQVLGVLQGFPQNLPDAFASWNSWEIQVSFKNRRFTYLDDNVMSVQVPQQGTKLWYDDDGKSYTYVYYPEWIRNCEINYLPDFNNVFRWKGGQMVFQTNIGTAGDPSSKVVIGEFGAINVAFPVPNNDPGGSVWQGEPYIVLPTNYIELMWYQIPYRYITSPNSFITRYVNHINQYDIQFNEVNYLQGELLFVNYEINKYSHPVGTIGRNIWSSTGRAVQSFVNYTAPQYFCDIKMRFKAVKTPKESINNIPTSLLFKGKNAGVDNAGPLALFGAGALSSYSIDQQVQNNGQLTNPNWIAWGHNVVPFGRTRQYYYATSYGYNDKTDQSQWKPLFNSFPFELLFKDPEAPLNL